MRFLQSCPHCYLCAGLTLKVQLELGTISAELTSIRELLSDSEHVNRLCTELNALTMEITSLEGRLQGLYGKSVGPHHSRIGGWENAWASEGRPSLSQRKNVPAVCSTVIHIRGVLSKQLEVAKSRRDQLRYEILNLEKVFLSRCLLTPKEKLSAETQLHKATVQRDILRFVLSSCQISLPLVVWKVSLTKEIDSCNLSPLNLWYFFWTSSWCSENPSTTGALGTSARRYFQKATRGWICPSKSQLISFSSSLLPQGLVCFRGYGLRFDNWDWKRWDFDERDPQVIYFRNFLY